MAAMLLAALFLGYSLFRFFLFLIIDYLHSND